MSKIIAVLMVLIILQCSGMEEQVLKKEEPPSVSYIYYPSGQEFPVGHAEIEVEGTSWTLLSDKSYGSKPLEKIKDKSSKDGWPFFRFVLAAHPDQVEKIKKSIDKKERVWNCNRGALRPLSDAGVCHVPLPINISPLLTGSYLALNQKLECNNVKKIEYYGNPSLNQSVRKMLIGSSVECFLIVGVTSYLCTISFIFYMLKVLDE